MTDISPWIRLEDKIPKNRQQIFMTSNGKIYIVETMIKSIFANKNSLHLIDFIVLPTPSNTDNFVHAVILGRPTLIWCPLPEIPKGYKEDPIMNFL